MLCRRCATDTVLRTLCYEAGLGLETEYQPLLHSVEGSEHPMCWAVEWRGRHVFALASEGHGRFVRWERGVVERC